MRDISRFNVAMSSATVSNSFYSYELRITVSVNSAEVSGVLKEHHIIHLNYAMVSIILSARYDP